MSEFEFSEHSHRRHNPLSNGWVLVSPHRAKRPWLGLQEDTNQEKRPEYDPKCFLCPRNKRAEGGLVNADYHSTFIFKNDFTAVRPDQPDFETVQDESLESRFLQAKGVKGQCYVICFSPRHDLTIPEMDHAGLIDVVNAWKSLYLDLLKGPFRYVQIFENKGSAMGCSNPHPHGQAWCLDEIPSEVSNELVNMNQYRETHGTHLLGDYLQLELEKKERIVVENDSFLVVVPYWAVWPFETLLISKQHLKSLNDFTEKHTEDLASIFKEITTKYDNLFETSFPYSMGIHQSPFEELENSWFHIHFYPPLLRSATVKKFLVGFELLGEPQRDLTLEQAAARLRLLSNVHYSIK